MADPRFYQRAGPFTLAQLAELSGAILSPDADPGRMINDVAPIGVAAADQITFLDNRKYLPSLAESEATACILAPEMAERAPPGMALLLAVHPYRAYAAVAGAFYPRAPIAGGVSPGAHVDPSARIAPDAFIAPGAVIGPGAEVGARTRIGANVVVGPAVVIGADCEIGAASSLRYALLGDRVVIDAGARLGETGFGFASGPDGHFPVPQLGRVIVEDDAYIGANTTIDRGAGPDTVIGRGARIDNQVQVGHNVVVGPGSVLVAQVGIAGSTRLGAFVVLGGKVGVGGHLSIGDRARVAATAAVMRDIPAGEDYAGIPAMPAKTFWRTVSRLQKLANRQDDQ